MASTNKTDNIQLNQWVKTDPVLMDDMNADNQKIDGAIGALQSGMLRIATGSYTGNGNCGSTKPNSLSFDFAPKLVIIRTPSPSGKGITYGATFVYGTEYQFNDIYGMTDSACYVTWSGNTVSWYSTSQAGDQLNNSGTLYHYIAFG